MSHLESNLTHLRSRAVDLAAAVLESAGGVVEVRPSREGSPTAMKRGQWLHSAYDPKREAEAWVAAQTAEWRTGELAVVLGHGLLYHLERLAATAAGRPVAVVVTDPSLLKDALVSRPLGPWIETVTWVWGSAEQMAERIASLNMPIRIMAYGPAAKWESETLQRLEGALRQAMASRQSGRLHVAVVGPIYGGSLPITGHVTRALEALGHRVTWIDHSVHHRSYEAFAVFKDTRHRLSMQSRFADVLSMSTLTSLAEDPPDLVLAMAQAPLTLAALEHLRRKKFLTAMWFVENFRHLTYWQQLAPGYDYWFVIQQAACQEALRRAGAPHVAYLPMAADPAIHRPLIVTDDERHEFGADVSFVGAGYTNRRTLLPQWLSSEWSFKLWGNEWDGASALQGVLQRQGARIDTDTCLKVFNATTINLNLHSCSGEGLDPDADFVNPRTFELAACGAFQVSDRRALMPALFAEQEVVQFDRPGDVPGLLRRWLHDGAGRQAIAAAARQRVLREHTYEHRMKDLLSEVGLRQPDRLGAVLRGERNAAALVAQASSVPELVPHLRQFADQDRVELRELAARIKAKGPGAELAREELLILLLDSYRAETRDVA